MLGGSEGVPIQPFELSADEKQVLQALRRGRADLAAAICTDPDLRGTIVARDLLPRLILDQSYDARAEAAEKDRWDRAADLLRRFDDAVLEGPPDKGHPASCALDAADVETKLPSPSTVPVENEEPSLPDRKLWGFLIRPTLDRPEHALLSLGSTLGGFGLLLLLRAALHHH